MKPVDKKPPTGKYAVKSSLGLPEIARRFAKGGDADPKREVRTHETGGAARERRGCALVESTAPVTPTSGPPSASKRVAKSRAKNPEKYRERQREYMRKRREKARKGK